MEIFHVVIAEDEPYAARHIRALVEREENFSVSAVYESGEDALRGLQSPRLQADLLITDIQMPGISGLDLIREAQRVRPGIPSIIISGYGSFTYAKEAISLGTMQYILKPIDVNELRAALLEAGREIERGRLEAGQQFIRKIQKNSEAVFSPDASFDRETSYRVLVFALSLSVEETILQCLEYLQKWDCVVLSYRYSMVLLWPENAGESLEAFARTLKNKVCGREQNGVFVIGDTLAAGEAVREEIERLYDMLQGCFYLGETQIVTKDMGQTRQQADAEEYHRLTAQLLQQVHSQKISDLKTVYDRLFDFFGQKKASVREMRHTLYLLVSRLYQLDAERFDPTVESNRIMRRLYTARDYEEARARIWEIIEQLPRKNPPETEHMDSGSETYWKVVHFLNANISENYSLQEIADSFHISQPYLSRLFRKYKGMSYKEYCTNLKVQTSIRLMEENPHMLIKEIAERVGYDQLYFSSVFYRVMGEYPKQYRSRLSGEKAAVPQN